MASEFLQKQRGEFSSFWDREVARPARETYLRWKNQAIGYLGLGKDKPMAVQRIESPDPRMTAEQRAAQRALIQEGIARGRRNIRIELALSSLFLTGVLAVGAYTWLIEQSGISANANPQDNTHPSVTAPVPAGVVETLTATATSLPPTWTLVPATETLTPEPTDRPTATERVLPSVWSPELSQEEQLAYLNDMFARTKPIVLSDGSGVAYGIYPEKVGYALQNPSLENTPIWNLMKIWDKTFGVGMGGKDPFNGGAASGIFLPGEDGPLVKIEPVIDDSPLYRFKVENVPYLLLAIPYLGEDGQPERWVVVQVIKTEEECHRILRIDENGRQGPGRLMEVIPGSPQQVQVDFSFDGAFIQDKCLQFRGKYKMSWWWRNYGYVYAQARFQKPSFWERLEDPEVTNSPVFYLGPKYSIQVGDIFAQE